MLVVSQVVSPRFNFNKDLDSKFEEFKKEAKKICHVITIRTDCLILLPTNCLSVFDHFVRLALKRIKHLIALISFYTPSKNQRFPDIFMRYRKRPVA